MDTAKILTELRSERERIERAITALEALDFTSALTRQTTRQSALKQRGHRMSPAARKRMSEMMKNRWAERKKTAKSTTSANKTAAKNATPARHMSAATKKKLSLAAKKRWAEKQKSAKA